MNTKPFKKPLGNPFSNPFAIGLGGVRPPSYDNLLLWAKGNVTPDGLYRKDSYTPPGDFPLEMSHSHCTSLILTESGSTDSDYGTIVSYDGTATIAYDGSTISVTASGIIYNLLFSGGAHFRCAEGSGLTSYDDTGLNSITWLADINTLWNDYQDTHHDNVVSGFWTINNDDVKYPYAVSGFDNYHIANTWNGSETMYSCPEVVVDPTPDPGPDPSGHYVTNSGTRTNGQSITGDWSDTNCYGTIQAAIDQTVDADTVVVADGTYIGVGNVPFNTNGKAITVQSLNGRDNVILDALGTTRHIFFSTGETNTTIVDGFTFTSGTGDYGGSLRFLASPTVKNCIVKDSRSIVHGGGVNIYNCSPTLINLTIKNNTAGFNGYGGGIRCLDATGNTTLSGCTIHDNAGGDGSSANGGGIFVNGGALIEDCVFYNNTVHHAGGGISMVGAATRQIIRRCIIYDNESVITGGGIHTRDSATPTIEYCLVYNNTSSGGNISDTGGVSAYNSCDISLYNCTVVGNNNVNSNNVNISSAGNSNINLTNCISVPVVSGTNLYFESGSTYDVTYSNINGGYTGTGNISDDPLFVDSDSDNYRLSTTSTCIDNGTLVVGISDGSDLDGTLIDATPDIGCYEYHSTTVGGSDLIVADALGTGPFFYDIYANRIPRSEDEMVTHAETSDIFFFCARNGKREARHYNEVLVGQELIDADGWCLTTQNTDTLVDSEGNVLVDDSGNVLVSEK